ncbi:MAG: DEAD/DEAH box helicase [Gemmataceae bacterium]
MPAPTRDELATRYLEGLPYPPYPVQEDALLAWFTSEQGVLVCAPTGTGKTLIAQAALYEALHSNTIAYYTTPLIALTEQKFFEMQAAAERWGFSKDDVGLVTGNRKVNPGARILVVVAEILLNRLLHAEGFDFQHVSAVVMDEFHSFADPERGIVWELSLNMLPKHVRLLLLSATVGNAVEFVNWLDRCHGRQLELVEGRERKVPLTYHYVANDYLNDHLVAMAKGDDATRKTPALVFAFNRDECWSIAEQWKGLDLLAPSQKTELNKAVDALDWPQGVGPKLKQMLRRGVGVHHAGLLPKYRRTVEDLFEKKLLSVALCTETLAAGINLPARSVVVTSLVKGPFGKEKLIDSSSAHQIFGRAGRPQFDKEGHVYAIAHEDDVRIVKWKAQYDLIPDTTKDPLLIKKKKELLRKKPTRNDKKKYWTQTDFEKLQAAPPARLYSKGPLPWRLLAYLLTVSPEVDRIRSVVKKRLLDQPRVEAGMKQLDRMLYTLHDRGFVTLEPAPAYVEPTVAGEPVTPSFQNLLPHYQAVFAKPTEKLATLLAFRACHPLYGAFLAERLGAMTREERVQAFESILELPRPLLKFTRVPFDLQAGPYTKEVLDPELIARGLMVPPAEKSEGDDEDDGEEEFIPWDERPPLFAEKLRLLFDALNPDVTDVNTTAVWAAGEVLQFAGNFNAFIASKDLAKQEGIIFRHLLRMILLMEEFEGMTPPGADPVEWKKELQEISDTLTKACRQVDPASTDLTIQKAHQAVDVVSGETETVANPPLPESAQPEEAADDFAAGLIDE